MATAANEDETAKSDETASTQTDGSEAAEGESQHDGSAGDDELDGDDSVRRFEDFLTGAGSDVPNKRVKVEAARLAMASLFYPLGCAKTLIQLGHEPQPATFCRAYGAFGPTKHRYPNSLQYVNYLARAEGWGACYRGFLPTISAHLVGVVVTHYASEWLDENVPSLAKMPDEQPEKESDRDALDRVVRRAARDVLTKAAVAVATRPFHVVAIRMIAELAGGSGIYTEALAAVQTMWREEGLAGFYKGFKAQLFFEVTTVCLTYTLQYLIDRAFVKLFATGDEDADEPMDANEREMIDMSRKAFRMAVPLVVSGRVYQYQLASTVLAVRGAPTLNVASAACNLPDVSNTWLLVKRLKAEGLHRRGASMFWRNVAIHKP